jgi:acyl-coenzyme A synthetase/AMP-(fatty) acid ligase
LFGGYLDPALNEGKFVDTEGKLWYRTGDLVYRDGAERLHHRGRTDDQVKIRGYRVELGEVEASASRALGGRRVAALLAGEELVVFVEGEPVETEDLRQAMSGTVPKYMVPGRVFTVEQFELTRNAKLDKAKLLALAQDLVGA